MNFCINILRLKWGLHALIQTKTCTCSKYFDKGVCKHLVAACLKLQTQLPGLVQLPKQFKIIRRHKRRQYLNDSREEDGNILNEVECENGLESENSPREHVPNKFFYLVN
jgi:uncharacterized Zn finger protein